MLLTESPAAANRAGDPFSPEPAVPTLREPLLGEHTAEILARTGLGQLEARGAQG